MLALPPSSKPTYRHFHKEVRDREDAIANTGNACAPQSDSQRNAFSFQKPHRFDGGLNAIEQQFGIKPDGKGCEHKQTGAPFFRR